MSGYPEEDTVGIKGWTDVTRPKRSVNGNYLLGFNETHQVLELVGENGNIKDIFKAFVLSAHPVGTVYETTDEKFDPNIEWGGVWEKWDDGRFLLSALEGKYAVGMLGGEEEHALNKNEMPEHDHEHYHYHTHGRGTFNHRIVGKTGSAGYSPTAPEASGAFYSYGTGTGTDDTDGDNQLVAFDSDRPGASEWTGTLAYDSTYNTSDLQGGG